MPLGNILGHAKCKLMAVRQTMVGSDRLEAVNDYIGEITVAPGNDVVGRHWGTLRLAPVVSGTQIIPFTYTASTLLVAGEYKGAMLSSTGGGVARMENDGKLILRGAWYHLPSSDPILKNFNFSRINASEGILDTNENTLSWDVCEWS